MGLNKYVAKQFASPSGFGGKVISSIMNKQNRPLYEETIRQLPLTDSDHVLDIGCGNGYVLNMIANRYNCKLTGIDISASVIKAASKLNRSFVGNRRMDFICQDMSIMPFADGTFDVAYTINTVYFWENLSGTMAEIHRILKPSGLFVNTLYTDETLSRFSHTQFGYKRFAKEQLSEAGVNEGFSANVVPILGGAAYCAIYRKGV